MRVLIPNLSDNENEQLAEVVASYNDLFEQLDTEYRTFFQGLTPPLEVNNIVTFYRGIRAILENGQQGIPKPRYFRLPLDEPPFVINMDTRMISVPEIFQNNGFGVKGDANAEVVFFKCDRYFDGIDLGAMTPDITDNADPSTYNCVVQWQNLASGEAGNSRVILADTEEDYIIFGWMITSKMTSKPGTIEFAVRWTQLKDGQITYSISTQKATCAVKTTIDLDYDTLGVDDVKDIIYTRPFYSGIINSMAGSSPHVTQGLTAAVSNLAALPANDPLLEDYPTTDYPDGVLKLTVAATSPDGHPIVYQWYNGANIINGADEASYVITAPGNYYVKIGNDGTADNVGIRYITSEAVTVPEPDQIKFEGTGWFGTGTYSDGAAEHKLTVDVKNLKGGAPNGRVIYNWKKANMIVGGAVVDAADATYELIAGATTAEYQPAANTEGYYTCEVVNKLNNASSNLIKTAEPAVIRAVPQKPEAINIIFDEANQSLKIQSIDWGTAPGQYHPEEIRYEWGSLDEGVYSSATGFGNEHKTFHLSLGLKNGQTWSSNFYCKVQHIVYRNNVGGQEKEGPQEVSNLVHLNVIVGSGGTPTVVAG